MSRERIGQRYRKEEEEDVGDEERAEEEEEEREGEMTRGAREERLREREREKERDKKKILFTRFDFEKGTKVCGYVKKAFQDSKAALIVLYRYSDKALFGLL